MGLDIVAQQLDFSLGEFQSGALEREPDGAAESIFGLLSADGGIFRRGGSVYKSGAAYGSSGLLWVWDGYLAGGRRTVFGAGGNLRVLAANDSTVTDPGSVAPTTITRPFRPVVVGGSLIVPQATAGSSELGMYGGSLRSANYSTGTVTLTQDSTAVVGVGTSWLANLDAGMLMNGFAIAKIKSDTTLDLAVPWTAATIAGFAYDARPMFSEAVPVGIELLSPVMATIADRLAIASSASPSLLRFSHPGQAFTIDPSDYHAFPAQIIGLATLRDVLLVFTTGGVYAVSGMAYPLVDPGSGDPLQRVELVNADLIVWGHEGIASWEGALVVPALDDVYLMDSLGAPTPIGDRILDLYLSYVRAGYVPGVAEVFNGHYFLPILNGTAWVDTLVCRLQPSHSGNSFAWTQLSGDGANVTAFAERQTVPPLLLAASNQAVSRVLNCSAFFQPSAAVKNDASGNTIPFVVKTIDYPTGNSVSNFVHHVRLRYELTDAAADNPTISAVAAVDGGAGGNTFALTGVAVEDVGEKVWRVNRHAKNVQFTFTVANASASCKIKSVEVFVRHSGRQ